MHLRYFAAGTFANEREMRGKRKDGKPFRGDREGVGMEFY